jgi:hypothetical protein
MERAEARRIVEAHRAEVQRLERRLDVLRRLIDGYVELFPELAQAVGQRPSVPTNITSAPPTLPAEERPKGQEAVRRILEDSERRAFTVPEVVEELRKRGWLPPSEDPSAAVRAALTRLTSTHPHGYQKGRHQGTVIYGYRLPPDPARVDIDGAAPLSQESPSSDGMGRSTGEVASD